MAHCTCANPQAVSSAINDASSSTNKKLEEIHQTLYGKAQKGVPGKPAPVTFAHWAAPEVTDTGNNAWSTAFQSAALAIAIANAAAQGEIHSKQMDLAKSYYDMAKYKWDRFAGNYMPLEILLLNEVSTVAIRALNCDDDRQRASVSVNSAFDSMSRYLSQLAKKFRLCLDESQIDAMEHKRTMALVDTENYNIYDDQFFTDFKNDQRWNRRSNVLNLGRNLTSTALKYGDVAKSLYSTVGSEIQQAAAGMVQALGYYGARNDTYYPTEYLNSAGGLNSQIVSIGGGTGNINPQTNLNPGG